MTLEAVSLKSKCKSQVCAASGFWTYGCIQVWASNLRHSCFGPILKDISFSMTVTLNYFKIAANDNAKKHSTWHWKKTKIKGLKSFRQAHVNFLKSDTAIQNSQQKQMNSWSLHYRKTFPWSVSMNSATSNVCRGMKGRQWDKMQLIGKVSN